MNLPSEKKLGTEEVYTQFTLRILCGDYKDWINFRKKGNKSSVVSQAELLKTFNTNSGSLSSALNRLEGEGLIERNGRLGVSIVAIKSDMAKQFIDWRISAEKYSVETFIKYATPDQFIELDQTFQSLPKSSEENMEYYVNHNVSFHTMFSRILGDKLVESEISTLFKKTQIAINQYAENRDAFKKCQPTHVDIHNAVMKKDKETALRYVEDHLLCIKRVFP
jgi:DNA-binding GntR family transcriptional regulator